MKSLEWWTKHHGELAPVGHALRIIHDKIWIRFHSLPESKRYPDSEEEMQEIVLRAKKVSKELFEPGERIFIYKSHFHFEGSEHPDYVRIAGLPTSVVKALLRAKAPDVTSNDDDHFITWSREENWPISNFEKLIREVGSSKERLVSLVSPKSGNIFCPYDGGMDVFIPSEEQRKSLSSFDGWRSKLSSGM